MVRDEQDQGKRYIMEAAVAGRNLCLAVFVDLATLLFFLTN